MKKSIVILLVIISIFVASCSAQPPKVTVTSTVTVTLPAATRTPEPSATPTAVYTPTPTPEQSAAKLLESYGIDPETYTMADVDGVVTVTDNETGIVMMQSSESGVLYGIEFETKIAAKSCEQTPFKPSKGGMIEFNKDYPFTASEYFTQIVYNDLKYFSESGDFYDILLDRTRQCWAISDGTNFFYRDKEGVARQVPLIPMTIAELKKFAFTPR